MKIQVQKCTGEAESITFINVINDGGSTAMQLPLYVKKSDISGMPAIPNTLDKISSLLQLVYNSGLKNEKITFEEKSETI